MATVRLASLVASMIALYCRCPSTCTNVCVYPTHILTRGILPSQGFTMRSFTFF